MTFDLRSVLVYAIATLFFALHNERVVGLAPSEKEWAKSVRLSGAYLETTIRPGVFIRLRDWGLGV